MKKIVGELLKNKHVDENLKAYCGPFMEINNKYANIRLAMNYYTYYTMTLEDESLLSTENMFGLATINLIIEELMNGESEKISENIEKLEKLRDGIIEKVQDLTCYVDKFNIYEHALNRVEYRFRDDDYPSGYSDENITRRLMQFILEDEDNMAINRKISQVIGQLPVVQPIKYQYEKPLIAPSNIIIMRNLLVNIHFFKLFAFIFYFIRNIFH